MTAETTRVRATRRLAPSCAQDGRTIGGPACSRRRRRGHQPCQADQVVSGTDEIASEVDLLQTPEPCFAEAAHGFEPAEDFLNFHANSLADGIPHVSRCPTVDGTAPTSRVLRDVRRDVSGA